MSISRVLGEFPVPSRLFGITMAWPMVPQALFDFRVKGKQRKFDFHIELHHPRCPRWSKVIRSQHKVIQDHEATGQQGSLTSLIIMVINQSDLMINHQQSRTQTFLDPFLTFSFLSSTQNITFQVWLWIKWLLIFMFNFFRSDWLIFCLNAIISKSSLCCFNLWDLRFINCDRRVFDFVGNTHRESQLSQIPVAQRDCQIVWTAFHHFKC